MTHPAARDRIDSPWTFGAVEAGGTKFRTGIYSKDLVLTEHERFTTDDPDTTIAKVIDFFRSRPSVSALGIACFGPVDLRAGSASYGSILRTPKEGWSGVDVLGGIGGALGVPTAIDSDVGAAAVAEQSVGAGVGRSTVCYVTVGTGIGGAVVIDGNVQRGHGHSEIGHVPTDPIVGDVFEGSCPYHGRCLEGVASGSAIEARRRAGDADPLRFVAGYLGQLVQTLTYTFAPDVIAFGGGVFNEPGLLEAVRNASTSRLAGYSTDTDLVGGIDAYVVRSALDQDAGLLGAGLLAAKAAGREPGHP